MLLFIRLDFRPPGERILKNLGQVVKNTEVIVFLVQMMFAGTFWGYIEGFLFWYVRNSVLLSLDLACCNVFYNILMPNCQQFPRYETRDITGTSTTSTPAAS